MARPVVAVMTAHTIAKHGYWHDGVELVPAELVTQLQARGALVVLVPSSAVQSNGSVELPIAALAGVVVYTVDRPEAQSVRAIEAFAEEHSVPLLRISGDGSADDSALDSFASEFAEL